MSYNTLILKKIEAEKYLSQLLSNSISEVAFQTVKQAQLISSGFSRLTWYSSCFTDNYQAVCSRLKKEDIRFSKAIVHLIKRQDIVREMVEVFVGYMVNNLSDERVRNIARILAKSGASFTASTVTNLSFRYSISAAVCMGIGIRSAIDSALTVWMGRGVIAAGIYGYVQTAADSAEKLASRKPVYHSALYALELEMLYFLIEPVITKIDTFSQSLKTDQEIASDIIRITQ
ncbi:MAG: hypothetical protein WCD24_18700 [Serratia inhibens]|uniref:hypothetical protein n=1 Tax=Serratia inhibens TaxID=2338073 RepID=UPI003C7B4FF3